VSDGAEPRAEDALPRALAVDADLTVTVAGRRATVRGYGDLVVVEVASLAAARTLAREAGAVARWLPAEAVTAADVTVDVRVRGASVAQVVPGREPGRLASLLGTRPARPSLGGVVRAGLRALSD
jgi:hypothetical protein